MFKKYNGLQYTPPLPLCDLYNTRTCLCPEEYTMYRSIYPSGNGGTNICVPSNGKYVIYGEVRRQNETILRISCIRLNNIYKRRRTFSCFDKSFYKNRNLHVNHIHLC